MPKQNPENPAQSRFDIDVMTGKGRYLDYDEIQWPTDEEIEEERRVRLVAESALHAPDEVSEEVIIDTDLANKKRAAILQSNASKILPNLFASKTDLTDQKRKDIEEQYRDGTGRVYTDAFMRIMGYSIDEYNKLGDKPKITFEGRSTAYLDLAEKIFAEKTPPKREKKHINELISNLKIIASGIGKVRFARDESLRIDDEEVDELFFFIKQRTLDLKYLKKQY